VAYIEGHRCRLVSRRGHVFAKWDVLCTEISHGVRASNAVLDGEIVCLDADGRSNFHTLLFRRDWPYFYAFDLVAVDGEDLRAWPLLERKDRLRSIMSAARVQSRLLYVDHVRERGSAVFRAASDRDLEGIVAKWKDGPYETDGRSTSWIKVRNHEYSQMTGRRELFERWRDCRESRRRNWSAPVLRLHPRTAGAPR
jgi:bifunctional non-homologous end joining protein LigD